MKHKTDKTEPKQSQPEQSQPEQSEQSPQLEQSPPPTPPTLEPEPPLPTEQTPAESGIKPVADNTPVVLTEFQRGKLITMRDEAAILLSGLPSNLETTLNRLETIGRSASEVYHDMLEAKRLSELEKRESENLKTNPA